MLLFNLSIDPWDTCRSRAEIDLEELNNAIGFKNAAHRVSSFFMHQVSLSLRANIVKKGLVTLDSVKNLSATNKVVHIMWNRRFMSPKAIKIPDCKLRFLLLRIDLGEVVTRFPAFPRNHKVTMARSDDYWKSSTSTNYRMSAFLLRQDQ
jgi:hypothetical protein